MSLLKYNVFNSNINKCIRRIKFNQFLFYSLTHIKKKRKCERSEVVCVWLAERSVGRSLRWQSFVSFSVNCTFVSEYRGIAAEPFIVAIVSERTERVITRVAHLTSAADQWERALVGGHFARPRFRVSESRGSPRPSQCTPTVGRGWLDVWR